MLRDLLYRFTKLGAKGAKAHFQEIGSGIFGTVFRVQSIAVKVMLESGNPEENAEIRALQWFGTMIEYIPYLPIYIGGAYANKTIAFATDYAEYQTLFDYLHTVEHRSDKVVRTVVFQVFYTFYVLVGLNGYPIVHGDITMSNILVRAASLFELESLPISASECVVLQPIGAQAVVSDWGSIRTNDYKHDMPDFFGAMVDFLWANDMHKLGDELYDLMDAPFDWQYALNHTFFKPILQQREKRRAFPVIGSPPDWIPITESLDALFDRLAISERTRMILDGVKDVIPKDEKTLLKYALNNNIIKKSGAF